MVATSNLVVNDSGPSPSTAPMPSVSSRSRRKSPQSRAVVESQIPRVHGSMECPSRNAPGWPTTRERKKDLPERYGPQMASTATRLSTVARRSSASWTGSNSRSVLGLLDALLTTEPVSLFHSRSLGRMRGTAECWHSSVLRSSGVKPAAMFSVFFTRPAPVFADHAVKGAEPRFSPQGSYDTAAASTKRQDTSPFSPSHLSVLRGTGWQWRGDTKPRTAAVERGRSRSAVFDH